MKCPTCGSSIRDPERDAAILRAYNEAIAAGRTRPIIKGLAQQFGISAPRCGQILKRELSRLSLLRRKA